MCDMWWCVMCDMWWCVICAGNENYTGIASRDTANALRVLAHAVRGVAAGTKNTQTQEYILSTAQRVHTHTLTHPHPHTLTLTHTHTHNL